MAGNITTENESEDETTHSEACKSFTAQLSLITHHGRFDMKKYSWVRVVHITSDLASEHMCTAKDKVGV